MRRPLSRSILLVACINILSVFTTHAQWATTGNTGASGQWLGTNNAFPLSFKTNNTERFNIASDGTVKFSGLSSSGSGLLMLSSTGIASRTNLTGNDAQFLNGSGHFSTLTNATGWTLGTGKITTTNKIGIGVTNPFQSLEVLGNGVFTGYVAAENFIVADIATVQGRLSLTNNMNFYGYDPIAGTHNEIYTTTQPFYMQSTAGYNLNTYINYNNTGKVGIGTDSPTAKLHVVGNTVFEGELKIDSLKLGDDLTFTYTGPGSSPATVIVDEPGSGGSHPLPAHPCEEPDVSLIHAVNGVYNSFHYSGGQYYTMMSGINGTDGVIDVAGENSRLFINKYCGKDVYVCTGSNGGQVYMTSDSGQVGVGTTDPEGKLQVKTGTYSRLSFGNALYPGLMYGTSYMGFNAARTSAGTWKTYTDGAHNGAAVMYSNVMGDLFFSTLAHTGTAEQTGITDSLVVENTQLYIAATGETGFGTRCIPGGFKMAVDGKIICEGVRVKNSDSTGCWPDYVFDAAYQPLGIDALGQYVKQNKHLPGVPSAADVLANGVDLVEMNKALLKATEENSLYIIELKKANDLLRQEVEVLKELVKNKK